MPLLTDLMVKNEHPQPSGEDDRPIVGISLPQYINPTIKPDVISADAREGRMDNFSWSQTVTYHDK